MKKLSLALGSMGLLSILPAAYADISVPSLPGGFEATVAGLYLNARDNNLNYLTQSLIQNFDIASNFTINTGNSQHINLGYQLGFMLGVGYLFPNTSNDIQVDWTHLATGSQNGPVANINTGYTFGTFILTTSNSDSGQANLRDDSVDVDVGQFVDLGSSLTIRGYAGLRYLNLDQKLDTASTMSAYQDDTSGNDSYLFTSLATAASSSQFEGLGPLLGLDGNYKLSNDFGIEANADGAILVGSERDSGALAISQAYTALQTAPVTSSAIQNIPSFSQTRIVTALDGKLGLDYSRNIHDVDFTLAGGYQVSEYFNALDRINADSATFFAANNVIIPEDGGVFTPIPVSTHAGNVGIDGPYLSLTVKA